VTVREIDRLPDTSVDRPAGHAACESVVP